MKTTERKIMNEKIYRHGEELKRFFNLDPSVDPVKLSKQLFSIENKAHHAITCLCNTNNLYFLDQPNRAAPVRESTEEEQDKYFEKIWKRITKILGADAAKIIKMNFDPRGYALKIPVNYAKDWNGCKDWGGYGIIAPDFKEEN